MKRKKGVLLKWLSKYWQFILLAIVILFLLVILLYVGKEQGNWIWNKEVTSALLGAAIVTTITYVLLKGQADNESDVDQKKKVFENQVKVYEQFLNTLQEVVVKNEVTPNDEKRLQFCVAAIGMHATSEEMLRLSINLKRIIRKLKVQNPIDGSIWKEIIDIVGMFQKSLHGEQILERDTYMNKALRNFSGLCTEEHQEVLEYIECMLSDFYFDSFISDRCLFLSLPFNSHISKELKSAIGRKGTIPKRLYITLQINDESDGLYNGRVVIYCGKTPKERELITTIYDCYWQTPNKPRWNKEDFMKNETPITLSVNSIEQAYSYNFEDKTKEDIRSLLVSVFIYLNKVWAGKSQFVTVMAMEKDKSGNIHESRKKIDFGYEASTPTKYYHYESDSTLNM